MTLLRQRRPLATTADLAFVRGMIIDGIEVIRLRDMASHRIDELRSKMVLRVLNALLRRHKEHTRGLEVRPSLRDWLDGKQLESTYQSKGNGFSYRVRLAWAASPIRAARHKAMSYDAVEGDDEWYYAALETAINARIHDDGPRVSVSPVNSTEVGYAGVPTILFGTTLF